MRKPTAYLDPPGAPLSSAWANAYDIVTSGDQTTWSVTPFTNGGANHALSYTTFQTASFTYSALVLKIKYGGDGAATNDTYTINYSVDGGANWTALVPPTLGTAVITTASAVLSASQSLSLVQVDVSTDKVKAPDGKNLYIYDIWTEGIYTPNTAPNVPTLVSPASGSTTNDNTPTLSVNYSDSDAGDTGTTNYRIATSVPNCLADTIVAGGTSAETFSNNQNTIWTPASSIGSDMTYYWCARNNDSVAQSFWTSIGNFVLDTTGPALSFLDNVNAGPVSLDTITANWGDATVKKWDYDNDGICSTNSGDYLKTDSDSLSQTTEANNIKYICLYGEDALANKATLVSINPINIDVILPVVSTVAVQTALTVSVTFSEAMGIGVTTAANYTISGTGKGTLSDNPNIVELVSDNTYILTWISGIMNSGGDVTITVSNAQDLAGNMMGAPNSSIHVGGGIGLDHFVFNAISIQTSGIAFPVTITAKDANNNTATNYAGTVDFTTSALTISPAVSDAFTLGILTQSVTLTGSGTLKTVTATDHGGTKYGTSNSFSVNAAAVKFTIVPPVSGTAGNLVSVTVRAEKSDNSLDADYQDDVTLNTTGSATGGGLVDIVNGIGMINIFDTVAETVTMSLTDSQSTGLDVSSVQSLAFMAGPTAQFILNNPGDIYAKTRVGYTVSRRDEFNNPVASGTDTVHLYTTSTSLTAKFYNNSTAGSVIASIDIMPGHFSASFWYYDEAPGTYTITASDSSGLPDGEMGINDGTDPITIIPVAVKFVIIDPLDGTVDNPITVTVQAQKPDNSVDTNYQQDVTLTSDGAATGGGLINIVNGIGTKNISNTLAETVNLSLADSQSTGLEVSSTQQVIFASGALAQFVLNDPEALSAGARAAYTVSRKDQYNNLISSGTSTVYLYSSPSGVNKKFYDAITLGNVVTSIDITEGVSTADFWYYNESPGIYTITASDNSSGPDENININDAVDSITVTAGPVKRFYLNNPGDVYAGTGLGYTVTRKDEFNNLVTSGNATVYLFSSSQGGFLYNAVALDNPITSIDITDGNSTADFWYYDETPGNYTITASDNSSGPDEEAGIVDATDEVVISAIPIVATRFVIIDPLNGTVDNPITVTVQTQDDSGNIDTTYQTDVILETGGSVTGEGLVDIINGIGLLNISDTLAETVTLSLSDSQDTGLDISSVQDVVFSVGSVSQFSLNNPGDMSAGTRIGYTVIRKDRYGNLATAGLTTVYLYDLPAGITNKFYDAETGGSVIAFVNIIDGNFSADFWYYDEYAATSTIVVSDNASAPDGAAGISDVSDQTSVSAGPVAKLILDDPGNMTAGTRLGYLVTRRDQFENPVTAGVTLVYLYTSSSGTSARFYDSMAAGLFVNSIPIDDGNESANFWYFDEVPGIWVITVSDAMPAFDGNTGVIDDADSITVSPNPIVPARFVILSPDTGAISLPVSMTIRVEDWNGNVDTAYQNDVTLLASGSATGAGLVNIINGVGAAQINDAVAETVLLSLSDTETTGLNVSSTAQISFSAPSSVFIPAGSVEYVPPVVGRVSFSGRAYPGANLSIVAVKETEEVIKKDTVSSGDGSFEITFTGLSAGSRAFALLVEDKDGRTAQTKVYNLNLLNAESVLEVNNIIVSPTIGFPRPTITKGDFLTVVGSATPQSKLSIEVNGQLINADVAAGTDGTYKYLYNTALLDFGSHTIRARQVINSGRQSEFSPQKVFFTTNLTVPKTDFNNDGKLGISDWSIFLARWSSADSKTRLLDDLNNDGKVDASDFSIFIRTLRK